MANFDVKQSNCIAGPCLHNRRRELATANDDPATADLAELFDALARIGIRLPRGGEVRRDNLAEMLTIAADTLAASGFRLTKSDRSSGGGRPRGPTRPAGGKLVEDQPPIMMSTRERRRSRQAEELLQLARAEAKRVSVRPAG